MLLASVGSAVRIMTQQAAQTSHTLHQLITRCFGMSVGRGSASRTADVYLKVGSLLLQPDIRRLHHLRPLRKIVSDGARKLLRRTAHGIRPLTRQRVAHGRVLEY